MPARLSMRVLGFGSMREPYIRDGLRHFGTMLSPYAQVEHVWLKPEKGMTAVKEAALIAEKFRNNELLIALDQAGVQPDSLRFSRMLNTWRQGAKNVCFVIGGAYGLPAEIKQRAHTVLSLSAQTYSHQLVRLMLLEQVFRGFSILAGHPYHK